MATSSTRCGAASHLEVAALPAPALRATESGPHLSAAEFLVDKIKATKSNGDFFDSMRRG
jgi:transcription termination factor Rho